MSNLVTGLTHGNGPIIMATYDQDYRLSAFSVKNGAAFIPNLTYAHADGINLAGITGSVTAANYNVLGYSIANRLTSATGPWGTESFTYDVVGKRLNDNVTSGSHHHHKAGGLSRHIEPYLQPESECSDVQNLCH